MKSLLVLTVVLLISVRSFALETREIAETRAYLDSQQFMAVSEAKKRWGSIRFKAERFRAGKIIEQSAMVVDLIKGRSMLGKKPEEVRSLLGNFSGYFWSDFVPAYILNEGWKEGADTWQLVFLLDDNSHVKELRIHKNCCPRKDSPH